MAIAADRYVTRAGDMLDLICALHYGYQSGAVERVLDANPGLADRGPIYAAGVTITLPALPSPTTAPPPLRLWD